MTKQNETTLKILSNIQGLREFLKSKMSISKPDEGAVTATIRVHNYTEDSPDGGNIVFLGV